MAGSPTLKSSSSQGFAGSVAAIAIVQRPAGPTVIEPRCSKRDITSAPTSPQSTSDQPGVVLHVANVGDCRAVLCRAGEAVQLTVDHTPAVASEAARVETAGGFVSRGRVNGILGVTRSFGDIHCKVSGSEG